MSMSVNFCRPKRHIAPKKAPSFLLEGTTGITTLPGSRVGHYVSLLRVTAKVLSIISYRYWEGKVPLHTLLILTSAVPRVTTRTKSITMSQAMLAACAEKIAGGNQLSAMHSGLIGFKNFP